VNLSPSSDRVAARPVRKRSKRSKTHPLGQART
jgi:hypothetical protein